MLRGHRASSEDVVRHEVKRFEARAIPRQHLDDTIGKRHQDARTVVRRAGPVGVEVGKQ